MNFRFIIPDNLVSAFLCSFSFKAKMINTLHTSYLYYIAFILFTIIHSLKKKEIHNILRIIYSYAHEYMTIRCCIVSNFNNNKFL
jgi:hypothetical protein